MRLLPGVLIKMLPLAVASMAVIAMAAYWQISATFKAELEEKLNRESELAVNTINMRLGALAAVLDTIAHNGFIGDVITDEDQRRTSIRPFFASLTMASIPGAVVGLIDANGRLIAANQSANMPATMPDLLTSVGNDRHFAVERERVTLAVPVVQQESVRGAVFVRFPASALASYMNLSHFADLAAVTINGVPIASDVASASAMSAQAGDENGGWMKVSAVSQSYPGLGVLLFSRRDDLLAPLRGLDRTLGLSALANLIVLAIGLIMTAMLVARPLVRFARDVNDVRDASDLSRRVSSRGYSEVVRLADTFNEMLGRLQKTLVSCDLLEQENRHRRTAEQTLRDKQAENSAIVETVADAIIVIDQNGIIRSANPATTRIFRYAHHELIGKNVSMLMSAPHSVNHDQYIRNYLETGEAKIIGIGRELEASRRDGEMFPIELFVADILLKDQPHFVGVIRDITERRKVDRMQREFIALVSHELRTPLTSLTGSLALVHSGKMGEMPEKIGKLVGLAHSNANRLIDLVNDIMAIEKLQSGRIDLRLEALDLVTLVRKALDANAAYAEKNNVTFALNSALENAWVLGDPKRLTQVLDNLLSNAAKFSKARSVVEVGIEPNARFIRVSVRDSGVGIPADDIGKVFDKFVQLDTTDAKNSQGSGLGLPIAQAILERHGSRIEVQSEVGVGSTFFFDLVEYAGEDGDGDIASRIGGPAHSRAVAWSADTSEA
ncbi:PAS domain S-box-containing protein [Breoghania corrubedonensis]|uniref:Sensor protein FixL n=1 Tax=Breoghania corrubedonensis TaxID=665038 RepID=A0A2T5UYI3_9HYPH|nr:PAS domain S-box protein [Breoghania corrubedonensis]PTW56564.1 PAS domain S-box-containing protein [Breoghania corrubedonensis]